MNKAYSYRTQLATLRRAQIHLSDALRALEQAQSYEAEMAPSPGDEHEQLVSQVRSAWEAVESTMRSITPLADDQDGV